jgi:diaminohydroxyphosphoribosylaminopyrimidine deaminase/5-amino-6-(5-phosphoribosylamino)uracil reductase
VKAGALDNTYMALALRLAAKGRGFTSPNPMVGALVVNGTRIIGRGHHARVGGPHAEAVAIRKAGSRAAGSTLYVSLEPCGHTKKRTPPCIPLILDSGISRVVVAMRDPNPQVRGRGLQALKRAGLDVTVGVLQAEAERLNEAYCHWRATGRPFVTLKAGMTLDGKIATANGGSQWITGRRARLHAHRLRSQMAAVMVGIGTVLRDDPRLTARLPGDIRQPLRIVVDSTARIPLTARLLSPSSRQGTLIVTTDLASQNRVARLRALGTNVLVLPAMNGRVSLRALLTELGQMSVTSLLVEGGSELNASMVKEGLVNRVAFYVAPRLLGGQDAKGVIGGQSPNELRTAIGLSDLVWRRLGEDVLIEASVTGKGTR